MMNLLIVIFNKTSDFPTTKASKEAKTTNGPTACQINVNPTINHMQPQQLQLKLKVSKSRKQILKFSLEPKNERKYFCNSALASKMGQIIKIMTDFHAN